MTAAVFDGGGDEYREEFLVAVAAVRACHDPAAEWDRFREALWVAMCRVFGVDDGTPWPQVLPHPGDGPGGDARAVAAWLRQT